MCGCGYVRVLLGWISPIREAFFGVGDFGVGFFAFKWVVLLMRMSMDASNSQHGRKSWTIHKASKTCVWTDVVSRMALQRSLLGFFFRASVCSSFSTLFDSWQIKPLPVIYGGGNPCSTRTSLALPVNQTLSLSNPPPPQTIHGSSLCWNPSRYPRPSIFFLTHKQTFLPLSPPLPTAPSSPKLQKNRW